MHVEPREGESFDQFLRRFKTSMDKSGILREYKRKRYFKSNGELQREKAKEAARRRTKRSRGPRPARPTGWRPYLIRVGGAPPPAASRCSARKLAPRSFPRRPPA